jgi:alpha-tubulin suppressor-like RCC1 family protein
VDQHLYCWGAGYERIPARIAGAPRVTRVATGNKIDCMVDIDQRVLCMGFSAAGVLGRGRIVDTAAVPVAVSSDRHFVDVAVETSFGARACARSDTDELWCWGTNTRGIAGILGIGQPICPPTAINCSYPTPQRVWPRVPQP